MNIEFIHSPKYDGKIKKKKPQEIEISNNFDWNSKGFYVVF